MDKKFTLIEKTIPPVGYKTPVVAKLLIELLKHCIPNRETLNGVFEEHGDRINQRYKEEILALFEKENSIREQIVHSDIRSGGYIGFFRVSSVRRSGEVLFSTPGLQVIAKNKLNEASATHIKERLKEILSTIFSEIDIQHRNALPKGPKPKFVDFPDEHRQILGEDVGFRRDGRKVRGIDDPRTERE